MRQNFYVTLKFYIRAKIKLKSTKTIVSFPLLSLTGVVQILVHFFVTRPCTEILDLKKLC